MAPKPYRPAIGPIQRRQALKELGKTSPCRMWGDSPRVLRRAVAGMFAFEPLARVSPAERVLLKQSSRTLANHTLHKFNSVATDLLARKASIVVSHHTNRSYKEREIRRPSARTIRALFLDPDKFTRSQIHRKNPAGIGSTLSMGSWSRNLAGYKAEIAFDALAEAQTQLARARRFHRDLRANPLRVLDVGSANAQAMSELKDNLGPLVEVHTLSPQEYPMRRTDYHHAILGEYMPKEFERKFDLIVSSRALEYSVLPHLAIAQIADAIAPDGKAVIQWRTGRSDITPQLEQHYANDVKARLTPGAVEIVRNLHMRETGQNLPPDRISSALELRRSEAPVWIGQTIAVINELARLKKEPDLFVDIESHGNKINRPGYQSPHIPVEQTTICIPGKITIRRKHNRAKN